MRVRRLRFMGCGALSQGPRAHVLTAGKVAHPRDNPFRFDPAGSRLNQRHGRGVQRPLDAAARGTGQPKGAHAAKSQAAPSQHDRSRKERRHTWASGALTQRRRLRQGAFVQRKNAKPGCLWGECKAASLGAAAGAMTNEAACSTAPFVARKKPRPHALSGASYARPERLGAASSRRFKARVSSVISPSRASGRGLKGQAKKVSVWGR